ncbi:MAG: TetR/AcrR family transcriptional regulator [Bacteroidota bacterium]
MTPRTKKQFREIREEKKTLIMDVALDHFANEGYHNCTISHIAKHAGISKGLMYNYFESKEVLLTEIINRSIGEISHYFDPDKDGSLSEEEFELFVRKYFMILREKLSFWRLYYQLLQQKEVRDQFLKSFPGAVNSVESVYVNGNNTFLALASRMISEYFVRKKDRRPADYDPILDMNLFIYTIEGFARITAFLDEVDANYYEKTVNRIIELYK